MVTPKPKKELRNLKSPKSLKKLEIKKEEPKIKARIIKNQNFNSRDKYNSSKKEKWLIFQPIRAKF